MSSERDIFCLPYKLEISYVPNVYRYFVGGASNLGRLVLHAFCKSFIFIGGFSNEGQPDAFQIIYFKVFNIK